jgi:hypothetical protein
MINFKQITQAVENILKANTSGYTIERNAERNTDPNVAAKGNGWINITKGSLDFEAHTMSSTPWLVGIELKVEIQYADNEGWKCEDGLEDAVNKIMTVLTANPKLEGYVNNSKGYRIDYEINEGAKPHHQAAIITIQAEVRS